MLAFKRPTDVLGNILDLGLNVEQSLDIPPKPCYLQLRHPNTLRAERPSVGIRAQPGPIRVLVWGIHHHRSRYLPYGAQVRDEQTVDAIKSAMHEVVIPACKDEIRRLLAEQSEAERARMWTLFCKERYAVTVDKLTQALAILTEPAWVIPEQE